MGILAVMDRSGDSRLTWNPDNKDETDAARAMFDSLKKKGHMAYAVDPKEGTKGEQMREFDPYAAKIIMAPPLRGG